jgi:DNA-binding Lrp family transcriptional regulator
MGEDSKPGPKPSVTDEEILKVFRETNDPVLSTAEVAEQIPLERRSVLNRLTSLRDEGRLESKTIGGRNSIWWLAGR